jgi:hypothetical protein
MGATGEEGKLGSVASLGKIQPVERREGSVSLVPVPVEELPFRRVL